MTDLQPIQPPRDECGSGLEAQVDTLRSRLEAVEAQITLAAEAVDRLAARFAARPFVVANSYGAAGSLSEPMGFGPDPLSSDPVAQSNGGTPSFSDVFRGTFEFVAERQRVYVPMLSSHAPILDVGCGRGEMLQMLSDAGITAVGVDSAPDAVAACTRRGLRAECADGVAYLAALPLRSVGAVFSAQVVEHLEPEQLTTFLTLAASRLKLGGLLIAETVNPESFEAFKTFHVDPTHQRPIFPQVLLHLCREAGFEAGRVFYPLGGGFTQAQYEKAGEYAVVARIR